ncbi:hypothetical protein MnTg02_02103 [bacterium MnTg02]|nr:hypothetical protein MnTg02_02103 [bacterium MnTg02]
MERLWFWGPVALAGLLILQAGAGFADERPLDAAAPEQPALFSGELELETENDWTFRSDDAANELNDLFNTIELTGGVNLSRAISAQVHLTYDPVLDPTGGRAFPDHGLYAEEIYGQYEGERVRLFAGKFNPAFGTAWDRAPGVYGVDFAEDYELAERLGLGGAIKIGSTRAGTLTLTGNAFALDTSKLSDSLFTSRGRTRRSDGGVSNTESLESFSVTLDGSEIPDLTDAGYHLGYRFQKRGRGPDDVADEHGLVAGLHGARQMSGAKLEWVGEVVYLDNAEGTRDELWYYTLGTAVSFAQYNLAVSYTGRPRMVEGGPDLDDRQIQVSAGVEMFDGWACDVGYKFHVEDGGDNHTVGLQLAKAFEINIPRR